MTPHEFLVFVVGMGLVILAGGFLLGRYAWPSYRRIMLLSDHALDRAYDEGYDDGLHDQRRVIGEYEDREPVTGEIWPLDLPGPERRSTVPAAAQSEDHRAGEPHDWRTDMAEQLAPDVLDAENLPGQPQSMPAPLAGEHHPLELEAPLPAILHLGAEFDGGDQTFARVALRQLTAITRHEAARRALLEECGVPWVPMEAIAA